MNKVRLQLIVGCVALLALPFATLCAQQVPHPSDVFGFTPGDDYKIADYGQMLEYYRQLDAASDRVEMIEIGKSAVGKT